MVVGIRRLIPLTMADWSSLEKRFCTRYSRISGCSARLSALFLLALGSKLQWACSSICIAVGPTVHTLESAESAPGRFPPCIWHRTSEERTPSSVTFRLTKNPTSTVGQPPLSFGKQNTFLWFHMTNGSRNLFFFQVCNIRYQRWLSSCRAANCVGHRREERSRPPCEVLHDSRHGPYPIPWEYFLCTRFFLSLHQRYLEQRSCFPSALKLSHHRWRYVWCSSPLA